MIVQTPERKLFGKELRITEYYDRMGLCSKDSVYHIPSDLAQGISYLFILSALFSTPLQKKNNVDQ